MDIMNQEINHGLRIPIISSGFIGSGGVIGPTGIKAAALTLHPVIMDSMRRGHFAIFKWARLEEMEPLSAALYKRLGCIQKSKWRVGLLNPACGKLSLDRILWCDLLV
jgi:hypothetical protein